MGERCNPYEGTGPRHYSEDEVREIKIKHRKNSHKKNIRIVTLTAENKRQSEEIRLLRRALGNCNPDHNILMPEEALQGGEE